MNKAKSNSLNIYQLQALKPLQDKYSPISKRQQKSKSYKIIIKNQHLAKKTFKEKHQSLLRQSAYYSSQINPEKPQTPNPTTSNQSKTHTTLKRQAELRQINSLRTPLEMRKLESQQIKRVLYRQKTQEKDLMLQQIQQKKREMEREKQIKKQRKNTEKSFVLESHKETIQMVKKVKKLRSKSQLKLVKNNYLQTEREHNFLTIQKLSASLNRHYESDYKKQFLTNKTISKNKYYGLAGTLAIVQKKLTQNPKKPKKQYHPKPSKDKNRKQKISVQLHPLNRVVKFKENKIEDPIQTKEKNDKRQKDQKKEPTFITNQDQLLYLGQNLLQSKKGSISPQPHQTSPEPNNEQTIRNS